MITDHSSHQIRVLRAATSATNPSPFSALIEGNHVVQLGNVSFASSQLRLIQPETEPGATFPWQYQQYVDGSTRLVELAVIVSGQGVVETGERGQVLESLSFQAGDVILIPSNVLYRIRNTSDECPLRAIVIFAEGITSYWEDGSVA